MKRRRGSSLAFVSPLGGRVRIRIDRIDYLDSSCLSFQTVTNGRRHEKTVIFVIAICDVFHLDRFDGENVV